MAYQIRPVSFRRSTLPSPDDIARFIEDNSDQRVLVGESEYPGQYAVAFEAYPGDVQGFAYTGQSIVISGYTNDAPAMTEVLYSALMQLGGSTSSQGDYELISFPVTSEHIDALNARVRRPVEQATSTLWLTSFLVAAIALALVSIVVLGIYLLAGWVI